MLKKAVICLFILFTFGCAQTAEITEEKTVPEPVIEPEPEPIIEKMIGTFEFDHPSEYRPILTLTRDYRYFIELNNCNVVWEKRGDFEIKDNKIFLKKAVHSIYWLTENQPQYYMDIVLEIESENRFLVLSGCKIEYESTTYGFCTPLDGGYFVRVL
jgi:hypothetical protein